LAPSEGTILRSVSQAVTTVAETAAESKVEIRRDTPVVAAA
jgi:hypothetical protein